jgi:hypothetical protein
VLVLTAAAGVALAPAAHAAGAQNRVGAFIPGTQSLTRPAALESSCTRPGLIASTAGIAAGFCVAAEDAGALADPAASRVYLRVGTRQAIQDAAPRTADGDFIDPNTGQVIPQEGPFDYGHTPGNEWWRTQQMAREQGWTRQQVIEYENDPSHYQIEDPSSNRSHLYEAP